jgi:type I restriction-modification system DNA methylase subunit
LARKFERKIRHPGEEMARSTANRHLLLEDIRLCKNPPALLNLFSLLGYQVESEAVSLPKEEIGFSPADAVAIHHLFLLADQDGELQVILFELAEVALTRLRSLAANFLDRGGHYLLVATSNYRRLTFVNPRREAGKVKISKLIVDTIHPTRHDLDILEALAVNGRSPGELYQAQCAAFDVDRITGRFYQEYAALFRRVEESLRDHNKGVAAFYEPRELHAFSQRFLGRLMFLYFIQKKGWLAGDPRFLTNQFNLARHQESNYYLTVLEPLFFDTLNRRRDRDDSRWGSIPYLNGGLFERDQDQYGRDIGPLYLPNDLFDPDSNEGVLGFFNNYNFTVAEDTPIEQEVAVDPEMLGKVFENMMEEEERGKSGTFYTPRPIVHYMCREALLGYLQDQTGLERALLQSQFDAADAADADHPLLTVRQAHLVEAALDSVRVLDPTVGTGAFLVGMLQELVNLKRACYLARKIPVPRSSALVAEWKRGFIANCLYGVDIKRRAIEIARLRLWLSLVVDLERDQVEPLPNLDYKLMVGDSLIETLDGQPILTLDPHPNTQMGLGLSLTEQAISRLARLKDDFFSAGPEERRVLRGTIQEQEKAILLANLQERLEALGQKRDDIGRKGALVNWKGMAKEEKELARIAGEMERLQALAGQVRRGEPLPFFLYRLHFFEVFRDKGGFDIVIANPPYVDHRLIVAQKGALKAAYPLVYHGVADLYIYFYARGLELLRDGGTIAYITSNKFLRAGYGTKLRELLMSTTSIEHIVDFGDLPIFDASAYPTIVITDKGKPEDNHELKVVVINHLSSLHQLEETVIEKAQQLSQSILDSSGWKLEQPKVLNLLNKVQGVGFPFEKLTSHKVHYGVKTGLNEAFVIDETTKQRLLETDPHSAEVIRPWLRGRDVKRWRAEWSGEYLIFLQNSDDRDANNPWGKARKESEARKILYKTYPAIFEHIVNFEQALKKRSDQGKFWWEFRACAYYLEFTKHKIVWAKYSIEPAFSYDLRAHFLGNTAFIFPTKRMDLVGILNSKVVQWFATQTFNLVRGGYIEWIPSNVDQLPMPSVANSELQPLRNLVEQLIDLGGKGLEAATLEQELNDRVYSLFNLTRDEIKLIEGKVKREG